VDDQVIEQLRVAAEALTAGDPEPFASLFRRAPIGRASHVRHRAERHALDQHFATVDPNSSRSTEKLTPRGAWNLKPTHER
jgi:hypothetical protein